MLTSTLTLNRKARGLMRDTQAVHRTLMHACQGVRPLWGMPDHHHLVVRHERPVDWVASLDGVVQQAVTVPTTTPETGVPVRYAIIANPVVSITVPGKRGKRTPAPPEKWNAWLERRLGEALNLRSIDGTLLGTAHGKRHDTRVLHTRVLFTGDATVRNRAALETVLRDGAGPGKAYGCGLLLVEVAA